MDFKQNPDDPLINTVIKGYRFEKLLGRGAFGAVYQSRHPRLDTAVAVKYIHIEDDEHRKHIQNEITILTQMRHNNVVRVMDAETYGAYQLIVMEFIAGGSLRSYLKQPGARDIATIIKGMLGVASGLEHCHDQGILHLDLKPGNILLDQAPGAEYPRFILTDFGMSKITHTLGGNITALGGTPSYMSPEQFGINQGKTDLRSDIYSFGVMLYEMVIGRLPFEAGNVVELARLHMMETPVEIPRVDVPDKLLEVIRVSVEKDPANRYQTVKQLLDALYLAEQQVLFNMTDSAPPEIHLSQIVKQKMQAFHEQQARLADEPTMPPPPDIPEKPEEIKLVITHPDAVVENFVVGDDVLVIGRSREADIRLPYEKVSRKHAQVERGQGGMLHITDMGSVNKTYLNGTALQANQPTIWEPYDFVTIQGVTLNYMREITEATRPSDTVRETVLDVQAVATEDVESLFNKIEKIQVQPRVDMRLLTDTVSVGAEATAVRVHVQTHNTPTATYEIRMHGPEVDAQWYTVPAPRSIRGGGSDTFSLTINTPASGSIGRRSYDAIVELVSDNPSIPVVFRVLRIVIAPHMDLNVTLSPKDLVHRFFSRKSTLTIINQGNYSETFRILVEPSDLLKVKPEVDQVHIAAKQQLDVVVKVSPKRKAREMGHLSFALSVVAGETNKVRKVNGTYFISRRNFPNPVRLLINLVLIALAGWFLYLYFVLEMEPREALTTMFEMFMVFIEPIMNLRN